MQKRLEKVARASRVREAVRSELVRTIWVSRAWRLRAGELSNLGDGIILLTVEKVLDLLNGKDDVVGSIATRCETYEPTNPCRLIP